MVFFFFKQKTAYDIYQCDWSSDVCSSDLGLVLATTSSKAPERSLGFGVGALTPPLAEARETSLIPPPLSIPLRSIFTPHCFCNSATALQGRPYRFFTKAP